MIESYKYLIAKNDTVEGKWLPLWVHCEDTYHVMQYLVTYWLTDGALYGVTKRISPEQIKEAALFLSLLHDYGKSSLTFQAKISEGVQSLQKMQKDVGLCTPAINNPELRDCKEMPHGIAGEIMLLIKGCPKSVAAIVGAHHGKPWEKGPEIADAIDEIMEEDEEDIYKNFSYALRLWGGKARRKEWIKAQDSFYKWALNQIGIKDVQNLPIVGDTEAIILSGLVIMADWLSSNVEYFPLIAYDQDAPQNMEERAESAKKKINLPPSWHPQFKEDFRALSKDRFGFYPNEVQTEVLESIINSSEPGLFILEAPMGVGKTEAALLASEEFSENHVTGMLFALPTQATANGIFSRILEWGKGQTRDNVLSIRLAHGLAAMNEEYAGLMDNGKHAECIVDDYEENRLIVHDFFQGSKQALLADFVIGTVDQVLLASLKQKHFMLRHLGLCGKAVIIDECHAYDAYMNQYLERTLQWLGAYRTPVIMLSATLPYEKRAAFVDAYMGFPESTMEGSWRRSMGYPLLTWTDGRTVRQKKIAYSNTQRDIIIRKLKAEDTIQEQAPHIIKILLENLKDGGCAAVVVNTVKRAQILAFEVKKALPEKQVLLLHSRFISEDRIEYEKELLAHTGKKTGKKDRDGFIVIGTQVIEQSLDFDVDLMITDLCPMDLLLQRIGRLHRHPGHDNVRPPLLKKAKCYVIGASESLEKGSVSVYGRYILMRTKGFLPEKITLPTDIAPLVQSVYDDTSQMAEEPEEYFEARTEHQMKQVKARKDADAFRLLPPGKEKTINRFLESSALADEEQAKAQVRNGEATLEAIVIFETKDGLTRAPWKYIDDYDLSVCPPPSVCREIYNQRVRLPAWVIGLIDFCDLEMPTEWKKSTWLRGQHLLVLDGFGKKEIGDLTIRYDRSYGLSVERRT